MPEKAYAINHEMDEATTGLMAEKGTWLSIQPFPEGSANRAKQLEVIVGTHKAYALVKKFKLKTAFGADVFFSAELAARSR